MSERAAPLRIPVSVQKAVTRSLRPLGIAALSAAMVSGATAAARAQDAPAVAPQTPPPTQDAPPPPPVPLTALRVTVRSAATRAIIPNAAVRLESETERSRSRVSDIAGLALFQRIPDGTYNVIVQAVGFRTTTVANVTAAAGKITPVDVQMVVQSEVVNINRVRELIDTRDTSISVRRDRQFIQDFPLNAGNRQDTSSLLLSVPGVAKDVLNRVVPRGEENIAQSTYTDGFQNPSLAQGRIASFQSSDTLDSFRAITGGFAAQYGGGSGLILDEDTRDPPAKRHQPLLEGAVRTGEFNTSEDFFTLGNRVVSPGSRKRAAQGISPDAKTIGYYISGSQRYTDNVAETAQDGGATTHNYGASELVFGKFDYQLTPRSTLKAVLNYSSGRSDQVNRLGLPSSFTPYGQGYGFAGQSSAASGLPDQQTAGQRLFQKDNNNLTFFQIDHQMAKGGRTLIGIGASTSNVNYYNRTFNTVGLGALPANNSVEYLPIVRQNYDQIQAQIDFTAPKRGIHQFQYGAVYQDLTGDERYQYIPQSQAADAALRQIDPRLATQTDANGNPFSPLLSVKREGYTAAAYFQDTFRARSSITVNAGVRFDTYSQSVGSSDFNTQTGQQYNGGRMPKVDKSELSPRLNLAFAFPQGGGKRGKLGRIYKFLSSQPTVARVSYNHLFTPPGLGQGTFLGNQFAENAGGTRNISPVVPQTTDQYDISIERQIGPTRVVRLGFYNKDIKNYLQTEQLIPGLESGMLTVFNMGAAQVDGYEASFDLLPPKENGTGVHAFLVYGNSVTRPKNGGQVNNTGSSLGATVGGTEASELETSSESTFTLGVAYRTLSGASAGLTAYYGSGLYASGLRFPQYAQRFGNRETINEVNLRLGSGPRFLQKRVSLQLDVQNLTDSRARMAYSGSFAGTRFQQGRRAQITVLGKF